MPCSAGLVPPGVDGSSSSTLTAGSTTTVPLIVKGLAGQTASAVSVRDSNGTENVGLTAAGGINSLSLNTFSVGAVSSGATSTPVVVTAATSQSADLVQVKDATAAVVTKVNASGVLTAAGLVTGGAVTATGSVTTSGSLVAASGTLTALSAALTNGQTVAETQNTGQVALVARVPTGHTVSAFAVRDAATNSSQAGFYGPSNSWQAYHGGDTNNLIPWRIHGGTVNITILGGNITASAVIDLSGMGWTHTPIITTGIYHPTTLSEVRRTLVLIQDLSTTTMTLRAVRSAGETYSDDRTYTVQWIGMQITPASSAG